ncbi:MAG: putative DNA binding protein [halophilic archaeon J07HX5]|nr:MAG: putative DNA binding protein [halophilic archaeon J07HX5]
MTSAEPDKQPHKQMSTHTSGPLHARLAVTPPAETDCPVVSHCSQGAAVGHSIKQRGDTETRDQECHAELICDDGVGTDQQYHQSAVVSECPCPMFEAHDCIPDLRGVRNGALIYVVSVPSRTVLRKLVAAVRENGAAVTVEWLVTSAGESSLTEIDVSAITAKQRRALEAAIEAGYYETPRTASLGDVADRLSVSTSAVSQRLNAAETTLVKSLFGADRS